MNYAPQAERLIALIVDRDDFDRKGAVCLLAESLRQARINGRVDMRLRVREALNAAAAEDE
jgi:hypothetical protein